MKTTILTAAALVLSIGSAFAGEGNGNPFPNDAGQFPVAAQASNDTGSIGYTRNREPIALLANDEALPQTGSETPVQTANSMPLNAEEGTVAYAQAQSMQRWAAARQAARTRIASR